MAVIILTGEAQRQRAIERIRALDIAEKEWAVTVEPHRLRHNSGQRGLYWTWMHIVSRETGNSADACHEAFKRMFLPPEVGAAFQTGFVTYSTRRLSEKEYGEYMTKVDGFITGQLGIILPAREG